MVLILILQSLVALATALLVFGTQVTLNPLVQIDSIPWERVFGFQADLFHVDTESALSHASVVRTGLVTEVVFPQTDAAVLLVNV